MAYAIVHFLVGASLFLLLAAPLALRYERVQDSALLLVTGGGLWGLVPDAHHISPVFQEQMYAFHGTPFVDVFAFHYMLDLDPVRDRPTIAIFVSLALFCISVAVFTATSRMSGHYEKRHVAVDTGTVSGILAAALVSMTVLGTVFLSGGYLNSIGLLTGSRAVLGWAALVVSSTVWAVGFGLLVELGPGADGLSPGGAAVAGAVLGVITWLFGIVMVLPVLLLRFFETDLSLAHVDLFTMFGFVLSGVALGLTYVVVAQRVGDRSTQRPDQFSLQ
ncbi:MAG: hypothetical protein ACOCY1_04975 [Halovenus sp.]